MCLQSWGFDGDSMGIEGSDQGVAGIDAAAGKKVSSGSPPRRGERIEETARVGGRIARLCQSRLQAIANLPPRAESCLPTSKRWWSDVQTS